MKKKKIEKLLMKLIAESNDRFSSAKKNNGWDRDSNLLKGDWHCETTSRTDSTSKIANTRFVQNAIGEGLKILEDRYKLKIKKGGFEYKINELEAEARKKRRQDEKNK